MVFDGGLRPTQTPGLESGSCQVENVKVNIIFPGNQVTTFLVERGIFHVDANQNLTSIQFYGPFQPLNDAINEAEAISQVLSLNPDGLEKLRANPGSWENPEHTGWGQDFNTSGYRTQFVLRRQARYPQVGADMIFTYIYKYGSKPPIFSSTPLQPPKGYENFSMKPPQWHPTGPAYPPLTFEQAKAVAEKKYQELKDEGKVQSQAPTTSPALKPASPAIETGIPWWTYVIIVLSLGLIVGLWYFLRTKE